MFNNFYFEKRVLITGHTGFKGSWLTIWLLQLGAKVAGFSDGIQSQPALFEEAALVDKIQHYTGDIRDLEQLKVVIEDFMPDLVFHLAAQAIVSVSFESPIDTICVNSIGTANVLEALRLLDRECLAVMITSDKAYENVEWIWGYKETDHLGGRDVYSASKSSAENFIHAYHHSFFQKPNSKIRVASGRAGNVIGGGDWSKDRIVPDCMRSWAEKRAVLIRNPASTRPWQHVLEPLSGYLHLGFALSKNPALAGESFNFGPRAEQTHTVLNLITDLSRHWDFENLEDAYIEIGNVPFFEASLLKLNCDKAAFQLQWTATLEYEDLVRYVGGWYRSFYRQDCDIYHLTEIQIKDYSAAAEYRGLAWTK